MNVYKIWLNYIYKANVFTQAEINLTIFYIELTSRDLKWPLRRSTGARASL